MLLTPVLSCSCTGKATCHLFPPRAQRWHCVQGCHSTLGVAWVPCKTRYLHKPLTQVLLGAEHFCCSLGIWHTTKWSLLPIRSATHQHPSTMKSLIGINKQGSVNHCLGRSLDNYIQFSVVTKQLSQMGPEYTNTKDPTWSYCWCVACITSIGLADTAVSILVHTFQSAQNSKIFITSPEPSKAKFRGRITIWCSPGLRFSLKTKFFSWIHLICESRGKAYLGNLLISAH